ncbi:MAG: hypothetical protein ACRDTG_24735 [Pseudonocardiaceae bacterium]
MCAVRLVDLGGEHALPGHGQPDVPGAGHALLERVGGGADGLGEGGNRVGIIAGQGRSNGQTAGVGPGQLPGLYSVLATAREWLTQRAGRNSRTPQKPYRA